MSSLQNIDYVHELCTVHKLVPLSFRLKHLESLFVISFGYSFIKYLLTLYLLISVIDIKDIFVVDNGRNT